MATTKRKKFVRKVITANAVYIDPMNCDSTVQYKVISRSCGPSGSVQIADCSHKIDWYFGSGSTPEKIDRAIQALQDFRGAMLSAQSAHRAARRPVRKKKKV